MRFYTIPYRLSLSRFIGNKILRSYYTNLNKRNLLNLRKKILIQAKRFSSDRFTQTLTKSNLLNEHRKKRIGFLHGEKRTKEISKNLLLNLEKRLDSSLLRLLHFKSLYTKKFSSFSGLTFEDGLGPKGGNKDLQLSLAHSFNGNLRKIKSPWKNFTFLQIKQKINHGHIRINGKKVTCSNFKLKLKDQITLDGFISNSLWSCSSPLSTFQLVSPQQQDIQLKKQLLQTFFFRNSIHFFSDLQKFKTFSQSFDISSLTGNLLETKDNQPDFFSSFFYSSVANLKSPSQPFNLFLCQLFANYIKHFTIKRFSEIFYLTYKNFFLFSNSSFFSKSFTSFERFNNIKFFFQTVGFNQSIYFLWPLISLLSIQKWNSGLKDHIVRSVSSSVISAQGFGSKGNSSSKFNSSLIINQQKNLKHLLNLKNFQLKLNNSSGKSNSVSNVNDSSFLSTSHNLILNNSLVSFKAKSNVSWMFNSSLSPKGFGNKSKSSLDRSHCYAFLIYGTRHCKWIQLQQQSTKSSFSNKIFHKLNFFEVELDFFQLALRHYKSN